MVHGAIQKIKVARFFMDHDVLVWQAEHPNFCQINYTKWAQNGLFLNIDNLVTVSDRNTGKETFAMLDVIHAFLTLILC